MSDEEKFVDVISAPTAGGAGIATATGLSVRSIVLAEIDAVAISFSGVAAPATTDVTVTLLSDGVAPAQVLAVFTNINVATIYYVRATAKTSAGVDIAGSWAEFMGSGRIQIDVAQADNGVICTARVYY